MFCTTLLLIVITMSTATLTDDWILRGLGSCTSSIFFESASSVADCQSACETDFYCDVILWFDDSLECYISSSSSCELSGLGGQIWEHAAEPTSAPTDSGASMADWKMISAVCLGVLLLVMLIVIYLQRHKLCAKSDVEMTEKEIMLAAKDPLFISLRDASLEEHYQALILAGWKLDALLNLKNGTPLEKSCGLDSYTASTIYLRVLLPLAQEIDDMASEIRMTGSWGGSLQDKLRTDSRSPIQTGRYLQLRDGKEPMKVQSIARSRGMEVDIEFAKIPKKYTRRIPPMPTLSESNGSDEVASMDELYNEPGHSITPHMHTPQNPNELTPQGHDEHREGYTESNPEQGESSGERFTARARALPELPDLPESISRTCSEMEGKEGEKKLWSSTSVRDHEGNVRRLSRQSTASIV